MEDGQNLFIIAAIEDGQSLFIIAAIVIAFVNWLSTKLKKRAAARKGEASLEIAAEEEPTPKPEEESWSEPDELVDSPQPQAIEPDPGIREFLDALSGTAPPPQPQPLPPIILSEEAPYPDGAFEQPGTQKEPSDRAIKREQKKQTSPADLHLDYLKFMSTKKSKPVHPIILQLRKEGGAQQAIVLSEILGKPRALSEP